MYVYVLLTHMFQFPGKRFNISMTDLTPELLPNVRNIRVVYFISGIIEQLTGIGIYQIHIWFEELSLFIQGIFGNEGMGSTTHRFQIR